jgi:hypothetical protein
MPDTKALHAAAAATEGDGVSYRGIAWFVAILVVTTLVCQVLMWGLFELMSRQAVRDDVARSPMAAPIITPEIENGRIVPGSPIPPPHLMVVEPMGLEEFRQSEDAILTTYGWRDKNAGTVRIPIQRAKQLLLERGIPGGAPMVGGGSGRAPAMKATPGQPGKAPSW